ncbi:MAG: hypothetical protein GXO91_00070 [FCB group bacterium]|nr:hypothetical protein [FCB group bacterium]
MQPRKSTLVIMVLLAALTRFIPHPPNFTPIIAIGLFGGAYLSDKRLAFIVPMAAMFLADLFLGLHNTLIWVYLSLLLVVFIGFSLRGKIRALPVLGATLGGAALFFVLTNFGVWITGGGYHHPLTAAGLLAVYADGIPFFGNTLISSLLYSALLFGVFEIASEKIPVLQPVQNRK